MQLRCERRRLGGDASLCDGVSRRFFSFAIFDDVYCPDASIRTKLRVSVE